MQDLLSTEYIMERYSMNRTAEEMASIFTLEELEEFERKHNERREKQ